MRPKIVKSTILKRVGVNPVKRVEDVERCRVGFARVIGFWDSHGLLPRLSGLLRVVVALPKPFTLAPFALTEWKPVGLAGAPDGSRNGPPCRMG